jgi:hypothetical protein
VYTIRFIYQNDKVAREKWYDAATNELVDDIHYSYNRRGEMTRGESFLLSYYTVYTYTYKGSLESWQIFSDGLPQSKAEYKYTTPYKNPFLSLKGMDYCFPYTNSNFGIGLGKTWYSSEKVTLYDETGAPYTYYEQKDGKTVWQIGDQNTPIFVDYTDGLSGLHITNGFEYENCKSCQIQHSASSNRQINNNQNNRIKGIKGIFNRAANAGVRK